MRQHFDFARFITLIILGSAVTAAAPAGTEERTMNEEIAAAALEIEAQLIEARRWFHQHPVLSNREEQTGAEIARRLETMGYEVQTGVAHNGVVAVLEGDLPGPVVAWRSDIDVVDNDAGLAAFAAESLSRSLGADHVLEVPPIMAAEDFAYFQQEVSGVYFFLGVANAAEGWTDYVHTPTFRPDESAIVTGVTAAASLLADFTAADRD